MACLGQVDRLLQRRQLVVQGLHLPVQTYPHTVTPLPNLIFFTVATYFSWCHQSVSLQASIPVVVLVEDVVDGAEELLDVVHDRLLGGEGVHRQVGLVVP